MTAVEKAAARCIGLVIAGNVVQATKYLAPDITVKATRMVYAAGSYRRKNSPVQIVVTIGAPNYAERAFIRKCRKTGEPFPVKKVQLKLEKK